MGVFKFVGGVITAGVVTVTCTAAAIGAFAVATKPEYKMLKKDIQKEFSSNSDNVFEHMIDKGLSKLVTSASDINIKDYVFAKTAEVTLPDGSKEIYIGAFQNWYPIRYAKKI